MIVVSSMSIIDRKKELRKRERESEKGSWESDWSCRKKKENGKEEIMSMLHLELIKASIFMYRKLNTDEFTDYTVATWSILCI